MGMGVFVSFVVYIDGIPSGRTDGSDSFKYEFSHEMSDIMMRLLCDGSVWSGGVY